MPRRYSSETWRKLRDLYVGGASIRQISVQTGIRPGTISTRCAKEAWNRARLELREGKTQITQLDPDALVRDVCIENARETRRYMSQYLLKAAKQLAETGEFPVPRSVEEVKALESIRASLFPAPVQIDHRSLSAHIDLSKDLTEEARDRIEKLVKIM